MTDPALAFWVGVTALVLAVSLLFVKLLEVLAKRRPQE